MSCGGSSRRTGAVLAGCAAASRMLPTLFMLFMFPAPLPASAAPAASGEWRGTGVTLLQFLGLYAGLPIVLFGVVAFLFVLLPSWAREGRNRPGGELLGSAEPVWFNGPGDAQSALQVAEPSQDGGGASAHW